MSMDAIKKLFFNKKPFNPDFWAEFWSKFDDKGYSLFVTRYKFNAENTEYLKTCNLIGGFFQRAEDCRKYAFGVVNLCGKDDETPPFTLNGAWLFRGPDVIPDMREVSDSEYFDWVRVDSKSAPARVMVELMFTGPNPSETSEHQLLERRYFK